MNCSDDLEGSHCLQLDLRMRATRSTPAQCHGQVHVQVRVCRVEGLVNFSKTWAKYFIHNVNLVRVSIYLTVIFKI